jgi:hypothetical protein
MDTDFCQGYIHWRTVREKYFQQNQQEWKEEMNNIISAPATEELHHVHRISAKKIDHDRLFGTVTVSGRSVRPLNLFETGVFMRKLTTLLAFAVACMLSTSTAHAQLSWFSEETVLPANPTSADNLKLSLVTRTCGTAFAYKANSYNVSMVQNNIMVFLGERLSGIYSICPPGPREEVDLGRLPPGNYTVSVVDFPRNVQVRNGPLNYPFTVANPRPAKAAPYVRLNYSGTWWDPNDPGWGLFIWQDASRPTDTIFVAWFTFAADGKPAWYTFQPTWASVTVTAQASLFQSTRPPGQSSPPAGANANTTVGVASLDFTTSSDGDEAKLTYTFGSGAQQTRTIKRFKP